MLATRRAGVFVLSLLAATACDRGSQSGTDGSRSGAETAVEAFFRHGPVALGETRAGIRAALGEPDSVAARSLRNRHDPSLTDSVLTLHYPGLTAEVYRAAYDGREFLSALVLADDRYLRPDSPLRLGMAEDDIRLVLGEPFESADGVLRYYCTSCDLAGYDLLELSLPRGQLQRISLRYWVD